MKKLGLIGGIGPESTVMYYKGLTAGVQKRLHQSVFPPLTVESLSVFEVLAFCEKNDYAGLVSYLAGGVQRLAAAGAELAAFTGITPHIVFDEVAGQSPIPLVSMVQTACRYAAEKHYRKVALLGTLPTMNGDFFQRPFREAGIEVIVPREDEKRYIGQKIAAELEYGIVKKDTRAEFEKIAVRLAEEEKAQAIVLGCTELPLVFEGLSLPADKTDVMQIHLDALIDAILSD